jgi:Flp pilus assembly protein TadD
MASIAKFVLILSASMALSAAYADELKDISKLSERSDSSLTLDQKNTFFSANKKNPQSQFSKAVLLAKQGRSIEAINVFTNITKNFPALAEPYNNLAVLYFEQGQLDKARQALETAIKIQPSYPTAHENLGDM